MSISHLRLAVFVGLLAWSFPAMVQAQPVDLSTLLGGKKSLQTSVPKAEFVASLSREKVAPGQDITLSITAKLPSGYYIYDTKGIAHTEITLKATGTDAGNGWTPDKPGKTLQSLELQGEVTKFYDQVTWSRTFKVASDAKAVQFTGKLEGQYCGDSAEGGQCIMIRPAYQFDLVAEVTADTTTTPSTSASDAVTFDTTIRPKKASGEAAPISYRFRLEPANAKAGDVVTLSVTAAPDKGWHTYSLSQPPTGGAPTEITTLALHHLEPVDDAFQPDHPFVLEETDVGNLETYHHPVTWTRKYRVTGGTSGDYGLAGDLSYVVCAESNCLPLDLFDFQVGPVPAELLADAGETISPFATVVDEAELPPPVTEANEGRRVWAETLAAIENHGAAGDADAAAQPQDKGLLPFLLVCVAGGFLALLTPCSFPMVPITVSFFLKQSEQNHRRPWLLAMVYCGSIVMAFTVLGVGISAIFGATKLNELANNPWINVAIGLVFVAFGLNMLGAFEIRVPTSLLTWSAMHEGGGSYLGAVFMALTFTLTSFTCTFAVAGSLLVMASHGDVYWPVIGMLAFGAAFASPFFVLALLPGMLKKLPKSGGWMNSVKVVMALIEIGAAVKFFSIADLSWNPSPVLFDFITCMLIWVVLSAAIGAYLLGWYRFSHDTPVDSVSTSRGLLALGFFGLTAMLGFLLVHPDQADSVVMEQIVAFAPPRLHGTQSDLGPTIEHHGIKFALDLEKARPVAIEQQRPMLLDFTGVNCVNCRLMEKKMGRPENKERMEQFVNVQLYADRVPTITDPQREAAIKDRNLDLQVNWFGDVSLPSYAVVSPDGTRILAVYIGNERKDGEFTKFLDYGWKRWGLLQANQLDPKPVDIASSK